MFEQPLDGETGTKRIVPKRPGRVVVDKGGQLRPGPSRKKSSDVVGPHVREDVRVYGALSEQPAEPSGIGNDVFGTADAALESVGPRPNGNRLDEIKRFKRLNAAPYKRPTDIEHPGDLREIQHFARSGANHAVDLAQGLRIFEAADHGQIGVADGANEIMEKVVPFVGRAVSTRRIAASHRFTEDKAAVAFVIGELAGKVQRPETLEKVSSAARHFAARKRTDAKGCHVGKPFCGRFHFGDAYERVRYDHLGHFQLLSKVGFPREVEHHGQKLRREMNVAHKKRRKRSVAAQERERRLLGVFPIFGAHQIDRRRLGKNL